NRHSALETNLIATISTPYVSEPPCAVDSVSLLRGSKTSFYRSNGTLRWTKDIIRSEEIPPYAILSHTWGEQEVVFDDLKDLDNAVDVDTQRKEGYQKIRFCAQQAKRDGLVYFWVDTCCINKANNTELSKAINSMFRWYQNAKRCYVFLSDVANDTSKSG
ncbi:vegetative incompatibility protein HET-E-1, partial [Pyrenophora tritici-repentis]